ncbi:MAG TPA: aspartate carbamoyltransferase catalytic subunit, partial [Syntrophorhabdaceae bacterium]|nr:aspartate carbamoyltransferase catalytic subunit [Syntrophorhabdaceae bacterium]
MNWKRKDLLGIRDLSKEEMLFILDTAESFKDISKREIKKVPTLRGKTVITLFYEPSTRTRTSFEIAAKRLSADTINISSSTSSSTKGESLKDTARNLESMRPDAIVIRHGMPGAPHMLAGILDSSIINGGDGAHEHPTQALLDLFTMRDKKGRIDGLKVVIVGDIAHSRVARSNIFSLKSFGNDVICCGPPTMIPPHIETLGVKVEYDLKRAVRKADVIMMLRIQKERGGTTYIPSTKEYST